MKNRNPFARLMTKVLVLTLLLTGFAFLPASESNAVEDPCSACYTNYNICIASPAPRCDWLLERCVAYYCN